MLPPVLPVDGVGHRCTRHGRQSAGLSCPVFRRESVSFCVTRFPVDMSGEGGLATRSQLSPHSSHFLALNCVILCTGSHGEHLWYDRRIACHLAASVMRLDARDWLSPTCLAYWLPSTGE